MYLGGLLRRFALVLALLLINCVNNRNHALIDAASRGDTYRVKRLLVDGADINAVNTAGYTAYMAASVNGQIEAMEVLKKAGAKIIIPEHENYGRLTSNRVE